MRDPARIEPIMDLLTIIWQLHPDLRLGQIIVNAVHPPTPCPAIFYIEDDVLVAKLEETFGFAVRRAAEC